MGWDCCRKSSLFGWYSGWNFGMLTVDDVGLRDRTGWLGKRNQCL